MTKTVVVHSQQRWEYCYEFRRTETSLVHTLNELGQQGWELVDVLYYKDMKGIMTWGAFMKRPSTGTAAVAGQAGAAATHAPAEQTDEKTAALQGFDLSGDEFPVKAD